MSNNILLKNKFIKDPIYGEIYIGDDDYWFFDLINAREFKRLKYIRQLGETVNVFYGATHNRFVHSIGVYWLTKKFLEHLKPQINKKDYVAILVAGLLHDIGHGPRSHSFEKFANNFNHEEMTCQLILNPKTDVNAILQKHKINPQLVANIIKHQNVPAYYYQIISSQIDADRLDYIVRDAYFIGNGYSLINIDIVIQWSLIFNDNLVFLNKAVNSIESILFTRYQMFQQIYLNKKVLCFEEIMYAIFKRLEHLYKNKHQFIDNNNLLYLVEPILKNEQYDYETFVNFTDEALDTLLFSLFHEKDEILTKLLNSYFYKNEFVCRCTKINKVSNKNSFYYHEFQVQKELFNSKNDELLIYNDANNTTNSIIYYSKWLSSWKSNKMTYYFMLKK